MSQYERNFSTKREAHGHPTQMAVSLLCFLCIYIYMIHINVYPYMAQSPLSAGFPHAERVGDSPCHKLAGVFIRLSPLRSVSAFVPHHGTSFETFVYLHTCSILPCKTLRRHLRFCGSACRDCLTPREGTSSFVASLAANACLHALDVGVPLLLPSPTLPTAHSNRQSRAHLVSILGAS